MKFFVIGIGIGILIGLVACTATPSPTLAPTAEPPTATVAQPTDTPLPAPTNPTAPTATSAGQVNATAAATETEAATNTPEATATEAATATPAATHTPAIVYITYQDFQILPAQVTIKAGTKVVFLIKAGLFTFHQPYNFTAPNVFEAPSGMGDGASSTYTFNEPGIVTLLCGYHADMRATLVVEP